MTREKEQQEMMMFVVSVQACVLDRMLKNSSGLKLLSSQITASGWSGRYALEFVYCKSGIRRAYKRNFDLNDLETYRVHRDIMSVYASEIYCYL